MAPKAKGKAKAKAESAKAKAETAKAKAKANLGESPAKTKPGGSLEPKGDKRATTMEESNAKSAVDATSKRVEVRKDLEHETSDKKSPTIDSGVQAASDQSKQSETVACDAPSEKANEQLNTNASSGQQLLEEGATVQNGQSETMASDSPSDKAVEQLNTNASSDQQLHPESDVPSVAPLVERIGDVEDVDQPNAAISPSEVKQVADKTPLQADDTAPQAKTVTELSKDERALRGLLQFVVCADARRQSGGASALLQLKYRELILAYHNVVKLGSEQRVGDEPFVVDVTSTDDNGNGNISHVQNKVGMSKEQLRAQLLAKQQTLEKELRGLRRKHDLASQTSTPIEDTDVVVAEVDVEDDSDIVQAVAKPLSDGSSAKRPATPNPPPPHTTSSFGVATKRPADFPSSHAERESALRRKWHEVLEAQVEEERLKAKKRALEELRTGLKKELAVVKEERIKAMKLVAARQKEEADSLDRLRQALAVCDENKLQFPADDTESVS